jgi:hypothetical protein
VLGSDYAIIILYFSLHVVNMTAPVILTLLSLSWKKQNGGFSTWALARLVRKVLLRQDVSRLIFGNNADMGLENLFLFVGQGLEIFLT